MGWLNGWGKRQKLTLDHTLVDADLSNFPVKVIVPDTNPLFDTAKPDGADVRFTSSDGTTLLDFEREVHDDTNSIAVYHVKIPLVSSTLDTDFYLYYGNASAMDASSPSSVWDSDYKLVMHMGPTLEDSTSNSNDGTRVLGSYGIDVNGCFMDNGVNVTLPPISLGTNEYTLEVHTVINILEDYTEFANNNTWSGVNLHTSANGTVYAGTGDTRIKTSSGVLSEGIEYILAIVLDSGSGHILYRNGSNVASNSNIPTPVYGSGYIGGSKCDAKIYEIRESSIARSDAWIKATAANLADNLLTFGNEESWISVTVTENVMFTDAIGSAAQFAVSATDGMTFADQINRTARFRASAMDSVAFSDLQTPTAKLQAALDEGILTQDQTSAVAVFLAAIQERTTFTDTVTARADYTVETTDGVVLTGTAAAFQTLADIIQAAVVEAVTFSDTATAIVALQAQLAEQVKLADSAIGINALIGYIAEAFTVTDGAGCNFKFSVECQDAVQFADTVSRIMRFAAVVSESFTISGFALTTEVIDGYMYIRIRFAGGPEMEFSVKQPETEASMKHPGIPAKLK